jgi:hypothetical protein
MQSEKGDGYRGSPVFHSAFNYQSFDNYNIGNSTRVKFGSFTHDYELQGFGQFKLGSELKLDRKYKNFYLLSVATSISNSKNFRKWEKAYIVMAWMPNTFETSHVVAACKLFYGLMMVRQGLDPDKNPYLPNVVGDIDWHRRHSYSPKCFHVFAAIQQTSYDSEEHFIRKTDGAPDFLIPHLKANKVISKAILPPMPTPRLRPFLVVEIGGDGFFIGHFDNTKRAEHFMQVLTNDCMQFENDKLNLLKELLIKRGYSHYPVNSTLHPASGSMITNGWVSIMVIEPGVHCSDKDSFFKRRAVQNELFLPGWEDLNSETIGRP